MPTANDIRSAITAEFVAQLQTSGKLFWHQPWQNDPNCGPPLSLSTLRAYRGINVLILALASMKHGYRSRWWGSYQAIKKLGGYVRRGEKATHVVLFRPITKTTISDTGEEEDKTFPLMRTIPIFNAQQTCGLEHLHAGRTQLAPAIMDERYEKADAVIAATGATIIHGGNEARYSPSLDRIELPYRHQFATLADYYSTAAHELSHWTERRLAWDRAGQGYAMGELIAELGGVFLCNELGLPTGETLGNHAAYLQSWLSGMANDPRFLFAASAQASRAVDHILSYSRTPATAEEAEAVLA